MGKNYGERFAIRMSLGLKNFKSLGEGAFARDSTVPAPLIDGYSRPYQPRQRGLIDRTPMAHEKPMAWFLAKLRKTV